LRGIISHDRWFLDRIATHILAFEGDSHFLFEGNFRIMKPTRCASRHGIPPSRTIKYKKFSLMNDWSARQYQIEDERTRPPRDCSRRGRSPRRVIDLGQTRQFDRGAIERLMPMGPARLPDMLHQARERISGHF
jgi:ATPase subunit of ABC transporter with duplicated ATPase domains